MGMHKGKIKLEELNTLFVLLQQAGYQLIGPKKEGTSITYAPISSMLDLPQGLTDIQDKGTYRLQNRTDNAYFGYNIGSRSFKNFLFPARERVFKISEDNVQILNLKNIPAYAFIGVRSCELHAIQIQDKVFMAGNTIDEGYRERRNKLFILSLNCHTTTKTCFCVSMNTGPEVSKGFDLNLNEIITQTDHYFILEVGSEKGLAFYEMLDKESLSSKDEQLKNEMIQKTASSMGRHLNTTNIKEKLYAAHNHKQWEDIANRCINCTNCTLACPTCFCSRNEDQIDLELKSSTRTKVWDSCFSQEYSYVHDTYIRDSAESRYRQWLTHKLASWHDQFDTSGCVGCGRCITWCPVGIDLTEEYAALTQEDPK